MSMVQNDIVKVDVDDRDMSLFYLSLIELGIEFRKMQNGYNHDIHRFYINQQDFNLILISKPSFIVFAKQSKKHKVWNMIHIPSYADDLEIFYKVVV